MLCGESEELNIYWVPRIVIDYDLNICDLFVKPLCHACHMCIKQFDWRIKDSMWSKYLNMTELNCALSYQTSNETKMSRWRTCSWWRHQMETSSALLALCAGKSPVPGEFPTQRLVTRSFDAFYTPAQRSWRGGGGGGGGVYWIHLVRPSVRPSVLTKHHSCG